jgi:hypothetical protein
MRRRAGETSAATEQQQVIAAMCGDEAVKEVVPWVWEFDLWRA